MIAKEALQKLQEGNKNYVNDKLNQTDINSARRESQIKGQSPFAIVLSCADSRVVPEHIFDQGIGKIFVIRVAGNTANPSSIASIEYAVAHLGTKLIVVLGHESCGACAAAISGGDNGKNLNHLLEFITPSVKQSTTKDVNDVVRLNAKNQVNNLIKNSNIISSAIKDNGVQIISAFYNLNGGAVDFD